jgi:hypothetical protein
MKTGTYEALAGVDLSDHIPATRWGFYIRRNGLVGRPAHRPIYRKLSAHNDHLRYFVRYRDRSRMVIWQIL